MEEVAPPAPLKTAVAKQLWQMLRALYYTLREGVAKRRLLAAAGLHLLLKRRGKIAGKAVAILTAPFHPNHNRRRRRSSSSSSSAASSSSSSAGRRSTDADLLSFSCGTTNTPSRRRWQEEEEEAEAVWRAFELLRFHDDDDDDEGSTSVLPSPSPYIWTAGERSPAAVRQLRVTDSPFPLRDDDDGDSGVDVQAEEFIQRFYRQLRQQQQSNQD